MHKNKFRRSKLQSKPIRTQFFKIIQNSKIFQRILQNFQIFFKKFSKIFPKFYQKGDRIFKNHQNLVRKHKNSQFRSLKPESDFYYKNQTVLLISSRMIL
jgi:hypothetical protein